MHGCGTEAQTRAPRGRPLGSGDAVVPGSACGVPLQPGPRERAAVPGPLRHSVWLLGGATQPRGKALVSAPSPRGMWQRLRLWDSLFESNFPPSWEIRGKPGSSQLAHWRALELTYLRIAALRVLRVPGPGSPESWEMEMGRGRGRHFHSCGNLGQGGWAGWLTSERTCMALALGSSQGHPLPAGPPMPQWSILGRFTDAGSERIQARPASSSSWVSWVLDQEIMNFLSPMGPLLGKSWKTSRCQFLLV